MSGGKRRPRILASAFVVAVVLLVAVPGAGADPPPGTPSTDYDLSTLQLKQATYNAGSDSVTTVSPFNSKILLPQMLAAPPGGRWLEVELSPTAAIDVVATWYEAASGEFRTSALVRVQAGSNRMVFLDLSGMAATDGDIRLRLYNTTASAEVHRVTRYEAGGGGGAGGPNVIVILVDDMRASEFDLGFRQSIPGETSAYKTELVDKGVTFKNYVNATPLCCPARASVLTGQYPHNHMVWSNNGFVLENQNGGILRFWLDDRDETSLGTWMQSAGYDTVLIGKYLNGYPNRQGLSAQGVSEEYVPNGWSEWYSVFHSDKTSFAPIDFSYEQFRVNENGTVHTYQGPGTYLTDQETTHAVDFIQRAGDDPFFMLLAPYAPHGPTSPHPDYDGIHKDLQVRPTPFPPPACNEGEPGAFDPSDADKPQWVQDTTDVFGNCWGRDWQRRLDMTLSLDDMIGAVVGELEAQGLMDDTWIFFTSDNGLLGGEHGLAGKSAPYEESITVPLIVRGPGMPQGEQRPHLTGNIDLAPTILEIAGGSITPGSPPIDGESLLAPITGAVSNEDWRDGILIELLEPGETPNAEHVVPRYSGVRTRTHTYVKYETTERELYDLGADPFQLNNIWTTASQSLKNQVGGLLQDLDFCVGAECADAARIDEGNLPPVASFTWSCTNLECSFDGTGSSDPDGTITQWAWDFGDGGTAFGSTTNHTFPAADNYTVQLTVTDDGGATRQKTHTVSVGAGGISRVTNIAIQVKVAKGNVIAKPLVVDGTGARVAGAEVTGTWTRNGAPEGTFVMSTNAQGRAKFVFFPANPQSGQVFEFCVTDVTHPDLAFQPEADDCGSIAWP